jgi:hypothetical protein
MKKKIKLRLSVQGTSGVAQAVKCLPSKPEPLSSNSTTKTNKQKKQKQNKKKKTKRKT